MSFEIEVIPGLEEFAEREIRKTAPGAIILGRPREGRISMRVRGDSRRLNEIRSVVAVYRVERFEVPRPTALLGHQNLQRVLGLLRSVLAGYPPGSFTTFRLSAAGADSPAFVRLKDTIAAEIGIPSATGPGDLLVIVRRPTDGSAGWEVLVRTSPRPLSARAWRVCDLPGALNASVAHVMDELAGPSPDERFLNLACGSGTLLIERLALGPAKLAVGVDNSPRALECAQENALASGHSREVILLRADATRVPLPTGSVDTVVADLPYGMLVGTRRENERLYPAILDEAARVAVPDATGVIITASRKLFEAALDRSPADWRLARTIPLRIPYRSGYIKPAIYLLRRTTRNRGGMLSC